MRLGISLKFRAESDIVDSYGFSGFVDHHPLIEGFQKLSSKF